MLMTDEQKYSAVLKELGELLQNKNTTISCQKWQIDELKAKLEAAEKERDDTLHDLAEATRHCMAADEAVAQLRKVNIELRKCVDLKNGIILDAPNLRDLQAYIQTALQVLEAGGAA